MKYIKVTTTSSTIPAALATEITWFLNANGGD
jgi:hypothetical protein